MSINRLLFPPSLSGRWLPCSGGRWGKAAERRTAHTGVKKLCQESENSAKPQFIHGHMFGGLGILAGTVQSLSCIPLSLRLHDGLQELRSWSSSGISNASHVVQMVEDAYHAAKTFGDSLLLPDRYFLSVPALTKLRELTAEGSVRMEIVTKAKRNCIAYEKSDIRRPGRGRPAKDSSLQP